MAVEVIMPKAGIDMTEGQIVKWNKKEGEKVEEGEILLEIMTDKTSMELEAERHQSQKQQNQWQQLNQQLQL